MIPSGFKSMLSVQPATELLQERLRRLSVEAVVEARVGCRGAGVHFNRHLELGYTQFGRRMTTGNGIIG